MKPAHVHDLSGKKLRCLVFWPHCRVDTVRAWYREGQKRGSSSTAAFSDCSPGVIVVDLHAVVCGVLRFLTDAATNRPFCFSLTRQGSCDPRNRLSVPMWIARDMLLLGCGMRWATTSTEHATSKKAVGHKCRD